MRFIERYVPGPARLVPWQFADLAALGVTEAGCQTAVQWVAGPGARPVAGASALALLLRGSTRWYWRTAGRLIGVAPGRGVAGPVYRWVARNRDRMPGGTPACAVRPPERSPENAVAGS